MMSESETELAWSSARLSLCHCDGSQLTLRIDTEYLLQVQVKAKTC